MEVLFVHAGLPRPDDGSIRSWRALSWLAERHKVCLLPLYADTARIIETPNLPAGVEVLDPLPLPQTWLGWLRQRLYPLPPREPLARLCRAVAHAAAHCDWLYLGWWALAVFNEVTSRPVTTWDWDSLSLWHLSAVRAARIIGFPKAALHFENALCYLAFERFLLRAHVLSAPSLREAAWLYHVTRRPTVLVRNCVEMGRLKTAAERPPSEAPPKVLFVGSLDYGPNRDGLRWFVTSVWPQVLRRVHNAELVIAGWRNRSSMPPELAQAKGITLCENLPTPDLIKLYAQARVFIAPIWYGGGIPNKVLEAAAAARPVVATTHIARAFSPLHPPFRVTDRSTLFAAHIVAYLVHPDTADEAGRASRNWVRENYSEEQWNRDMERLQQKVLAALSGF